MGANEHGVAIGNEGVHARTAAPEENALIGMDLLRLALERASSAAEAVEVITTLLERFGQGGNCGHITPSYYNNSFMVADASEAYVVETVGREWLVAPVSGVRSISNRYSIGREAQRVSGGLRSLVRDAGWSADAEPNYAEVIASPHREHIGNAEARRACSTSLLSARDGRLNSADMMSILRNHGSGDGLHPEWRTECATTRTLCMHAGAEDRGGQAVGTLVCELSKKEALHWVTATAAPCVSIFKPLLMGVPLPVQGAILTDRFDPDALWWRHERLHRAALLGDFAGFLEGIRAERDALEAEFRLRVKAVMDGGDAAERAQVIDRCWRDAMAMEERWGSRLKAASSPHDAAYVLGWDKMNRLAGLVVPIAQVPNGN